MNTLEKLEAVLEADKKLTDAEMRSKLISTYSAIGDDREDREQDEQDYEDKVKAMSGAGLKRHYNSVFSESLMQEFITKEGDQWVVKSKDGKVLGKHPSKAKAVAQLAAVEISKAQRSH